jgi:hypothetical protein
MIMPAEQRVLAKAQGLIDGHRVGLSRSSWIRPGVPGAATSVRVGAKGVHRSPFLEGRDYAEHAAVLSLGIAARFGITRRSALPVIPGHDGVLANGARGHLHVSVGLDGLLECSLVGAPKNAQPPSVRIRKRQQGEVSSLIVH